MRRVFSGLLLCLSLSAHGTEIQPVMGAGPPTVVTRLFFKYFSPMVADAGYRFLVEPRSIKTRGGLQASEVYLFGRIGRPLNAAERADRKHELFLSASRIAFVIGDEVRIQRISEQELEDIFTRKITNWSRLGGVDHPILLVGREPTESLFGVLKKEYPFFRAVTFDRVFTRDHQVMNFIVSEAGQYAISFGARANFSRPNILDVTGLHAVVDMGLVYDEKNRNHPVVVAARRFAQSEGWHHILQRAGFLPPSRPGR